jgi:hypothetical protein
VSLAPDLIEFASASAGAILGGGLCLYAAYRRGDKIDSVPTRRLFDALLNGAGIGTGFDLMYAVCFDPSHLVHLTGEGSEKVIVGMSTLHRVELIAGIVALIYVAVCNVHEACRKHG